MQPFMPFSRRDNHASLMAFITPPIKPPIAPVRRAILPLLQRHFQAAINAGELDFLEGRQFALNIRGWPFGVAIGLQQRQFCCDWDKGHCEAEFGGTLQAMLQMAWGLADGDALFFQRQLTMTGDTALALEIKGLLGRMPLPHGQKLRPILMF